MKRGTRNFIIGAAVLCALAATVFVAARESKRQSQVATQSNADIDRFRHQLKMVELIDLLGQRVGDLERYCRGWGMKISHSPTSGKDGEVLAHCTFGAPGEPDLFADLNEIGKIYEVTVYVPKMTTHQHFFLRSEMTSLYGQPEQGLVEEAWNVRRAGTPAFVVLGAVDPVSINIK